MNGFVAMIPKVYFPAAVYFGSSSLLYLRTFKDGTNLILVSSSAWETHGSVIEKNLADCSNTIMVVPSEPSADVLKEFRDVLNSNKYDRLIGFGGGSVMDIAKLIKSEYGIELVLIPTTFGTGSEVSQYSVFINERNEKDVVTSEKLLPDAILFNPSFLTTLPQSVIAYNAIDALSHAVEGLVSRLSNPFTDSLAITAIDMILQNAIAAYEDSKDLKARESLQIAGLLSGFVQSSASVGLIHACANYFGPKLSLPHGVAVAIFTIPVLELNLAKSNKYQKLNGSKVLTSDNCLEKLTEFIDKLGLHEYHSKLDFSGILFSDANGFIKSDVCTKTNPFAPTDDDVKDILNKMGVFHEC